MIQLIVGEKGKGKTKILLDRVNEAAKNAKVLLSVEMSMGQMVDDIKLAINCSKPVEFYGRTGGVIPTPVEVLEQIKKIGGSL